MSDNKDNNRNLANYINAIQDEIQKWVDKDPENRSSEQLEENITLPDSWSDENYDEDEHNRLVMEMDFREAFKALHGDGSLVNDEVFAQMDDAELQYQVEVMYSELEMQLLKKLSLADFDDKGTVMFFTNEEYDEFTETNEGPEDDFDHTKVWH